MIVLKKDSRQTKFFLWCLRSHVTRGEYDKGDGTFATREPEWYIENGTTLCHFFWACLWVPLIKVALVGVALALVVHMHIDAYDKFGTPGLFLPGGAVVGLAMVEGMIILAIIGAGKIGLLAYLKALKEKICPRMTFEETKGQDDNQKSDKE